MRLTTTSLRSRSRSALGQRTDEKRPTHRPACPPRPLPHPPERCSSAVHRKNGPDTLRTANFERTGRSNNKILGDRIASLKMLPDLVVASAEMLPERRATMMPPTLGRHTIAAYRSSRRLTECSMTNGADGNVTSSRTTGQRCSSALRRIRTRPPLSYSSSSRLDTQAVTAKGNCIPYRSESESGGSRSSSG